jgi:hypothetical protein
MLVCLLLFCARGGVVVVRCPLLNCFFFIHYASLRESRIQKKKNLEKKKRLAFLAGEKRRDKKYARVMEK